MFTSVAVPAGFLYALCVVLCLSLIGNIIELNFILTVHRPGWALVWDLVLNVVLLTLAVSFLL